MRTILIAEDSLTNRIILKKIFEADYAVLEAKNGQEALDILQSDTPVDIVLTDVNMPVMSGFVLLERMRDGGLLNTIPVIIITGIDDMETETQGLALGAQEVLSKPVAPKLALRRVRNTLALFDRHTHMIAPAAATSEKGEAWMRAFITGTGATVMEVDTAMDSYAILHIASQNFPPLKPKGTFSEMGILLAEQYIQEMFQSNFLAWLENSTSDILDGRAVITSYKCRLRDNYGWPWYRMTICSETESGHPLSRFVLIFHEIDAEQDLRLKEKQFKEEAERDPLTQVLNRRGFERKFALDVTAEGAEQHGFILIDIDDFKIINDRDGHDGGDAVLTRMGTALKTFCHQQGGFAGRLGGDEFFAAIPVAGKEIFSTKIEKLADSLYSIRTDSGIAVGVSIGCVIVSPHEALPACFKRADNAMYEAKLSGKRCWKIR